jgi:hypothetical protein
VSAACRSGSRCPAPSNSPATPASPASSARDPAGPGRRLSGRERQGSPSAGAAHRVPRSVAAWSPWATPRPDRALERASRLPDPGPADAVGQIAAHRLDGDQPGMQHRVTGGDCLGHVGAAEQVKAGPRGRGHRNAPRRSAVFRRQPAAPDGHTGPLTDLHRPGHHQLHWLPRAVEPARAMQPGPHVYVAMQSAPPPAAQLAARQAAGQRPGVGQRPARKIAQRLGSHHVPSMPSADAWSSAPSTVPAPARLPITSASPLNRG